MSVGHNVIKDRIISLIFAKEVLLKTSFAKGNFGSWRLLAPVPPFPNSSNARPSEPMDVEFDRCNEEDLAATLAMDATEEACNEYSWGFHVLIDRAVDFSRGRQPHGYQYGDYVLGG
jgi:hypothetical protein